MPRIGVTGHVRLTEESAEVIYRALLDALTEYPAGSLHGITCLAAGADQLFARAILARRGTFDVVLPARDYRRFQVPDDNRPEFEELMSRARRIDVLPRAVSDHAAFIAASQVVLDRCDVLIAVWDRGSGRASCTAEVVALADRQNREVRVVWPVGAARTV